MSAEGDEAAAGDPDESRLTDAEEEGVVDMSNWWERGEHRERERDQEIKSSR